MRKSPIHFYIPKFLTRGSCHLLDWLPDCTSLIALLTIARRNFYPHRRFRQGLKRSTGFMSLAMAARVRRGPPVPWLLASGLAFMRNEEVISRDINITLHRGAGVILTGPNASGKSSFLRVLCGFIRPTAGSLIWEGNDLSQTGLYDLYRPQVHLVAAKDAIKKAMTLYENVNFWEELEGGSGRSQWALDRLGLGHIAQERAVVLSMGQRKRLQLARMLAIRRPLWLLDEPSVGLDTEGVAILEELMHEHRCQGGMVVVATHVPIKLENAMDLRLPDRRPQYRQYTFADYMS